MNGFIRNKIFPLLVGNLRKIERTVKILFYLFSLSTISLLILSVFGLKILSISTLLILSSVSLIICLALISISIFIFESGSDA